MLFGMSMAERGYQRSLRRAERILTSLAEEIRNARLMSGSSQSAVAQAARLSTTKLSRAEMAKLRRLTIVDAVVLGGAVGLDVSFKAYPGRRATRDAGHGRKLIGFLSHVANPLRYRPRSPASPDGGRCRRRSNEKRHGLRTP